MQVMNLAPEQPAISWQTHVSDRLSRLVREQIRDLSADGFADFDVAWDGVGLSFAARSEDGFVRREFNGAGRLEFEKVFDKGVGVERSFDLDGITLISEKIFVTSDDR